MATFAFAILMVAILAMVLMGALTRSVGGAFLGLALVCIGAGIYLLNNLDWVSKTMGVLTILAGIFFSGLGAMLGINMSHSSMSRHDPDGTIWQADQTTFGEGAKRSNHDWQSPRAPQIERPSYKEIGDGR